MHSHDGPDLTSGISTNQVGMSPGLFLFGAGIATFGTRAVAIMSYVLLMSAILALPLALLALSRGSSGPFVLTVAMLATGFYALTCQRSQRPGLALGTQTVLVFASAISLIVVSPALLVYGLALLVLGAIFMGLATGRFPAIVVRLVGVGAAIYAGIIIADVPRLLQIFAPMELAAAFMVLSISAALAYIAHAIGAQVDQPGSKEDAAIRHLAAHLGDGYLRFSLAGEVKFASAATQNLFGCPVYELGGRRFLERVHVGDRPAFLKNFSDAVHEGDAKTLELRVRKDDVAKPGRVPEYIWIEAVLSPVSDVKIPSAEREIVVLLRDISRRKRHDLEMVAAREVAEEASKTKSRFLATIGHELRTPLNAIVGFSEMMSNGIGGTLPPAHLEYAGLIQQSGHHLLDVVNMLLDMSRIEAGKFELHLAEFEPENLLDPCVHMVEAAAREKNITLNAEVPKNLPSITGDERACRQILINLLSNAVKFSHENSEIVVRIKRQGQKLAISVCDSGIGMSREAVQRAGEPFFQAHDTLNRKYEGTGLGLSIVKGLVDLHQGTMRVKSSAGEGTQVSIFLPIHGPQTQTTPTETVTVLHPNSNKTEPAPWPEQKSLAR